MPSSTYVIMLNYLMAMYPNDWPISGQNPVLSELRKQTEHDGNPERWSKQDYTMTFLEKKSLKNSITGAIQAGGIYRAQGT